MRKTKTKNLTTSDLTRHLIDVFGDSAPKRQTLLTGTDISDAQLTGRKASIATESQQTLLKNITGLVGPSWPFRHHKELDLEINDELQIAMLSAPNLGDGFDLLTKFVHLREPTLYFEQFKLEDRRVVMFDHVNRSGPDNHTIQDVVCVNLYRFLAQIWEPGWRGVDVRLPYHQPDYVQLIKNTFACPLSFDCSRYAVVINEDICARENPAANRTAYNRSVVNLYKQARIYGVADEFVQTIKNHLGSISSHRPNAEETASAMRVSRRTLNRRLTQAGTSYRFLLDQSIKTRALTLLNETRLSRREIAERLGYNDQTSFSRALKRWNRQAGSGEG